LNRPLRNTEASIAERLVRHSKRHRTDHSSVLARYGIERLLWRLSNAEFSEQFVVKGAMLFLLWQGDSGRPTRDLDLLGKGTPDLARLIAMFRELCAQETSKLDGLVFPPDSVSASRIRPQEEYQGVRIRMLAMLSRTRIDIQVDIGFGDAITPGPELATFPTLLDLPAPRVLVYPAATVVAEKLQAIVELGIRTSRMKDFHDLADLMDSDRCLPSDVEAAIRATFARRATRIPDDVPVGLSQDFAKDPGKIKQWNAFESRIGKPIGKRSLEDVAASLRERFMPIFHDLRGKP